MSELVQEIILKIFGNNPILATIFISMIPIVELRGAIPFGSSKEIWGDRALSVFEAGVYSVIGSIITAIIIILLLIPVFNVLRKSKIFVRVVKVFEEKFNKKSNEITVESKNNALKKWLGIMTFVAIPLPLTGVWTGSAIAVFLKMGFLKSFTAVSVGALIAATIMMTVSKTLGDSAIYIFYSFIIIFIVLIAIYSLKAFFKRNDDKGNNENQKK